MSLANRQSIQQAVCRQTYLCSILRSAIAEPANIRRQSAANSCLLFSDTGADARGKYQEYSAFFSTQASTKALLSIFCTAIFSQNYGFTNKYLFL